MRVSERLASLADAVLPEDAGTYADNLIIKANIYFGTSGFMGQQIYEAIEHGSPAIGPNTLSLSAAGIVFGGLGAYYRDKAQSNSNNE